MERTPMSCDRRSETRAWFSLAAARARLASGVALLHSGILLLAGSRRKLAQDPDQLGVRGRAFFADDLDRNGRGQPVEPREQADALTPCELGLGRVPAQEQAR